MTNKTTAVQHNDDTTNAYTERTPAQVLAELDMLDTLDDLFSEPMSIDDMLDSLSG